MHGCDLATMDKPLERPRMDLKDRCCLIAVQQWLAAHLRLAIGHPYACRWLFLVGHNDSLLQANPHLLVYKRGSRSEADSSNEILGVRHAFWA